ncbi:MAG: radical SAM protein [Thermoanaerobacteraceae bacterium]|nr:radical SAM protein [Thermoanaerobacteraceae bacterium]
MYKINEIFLSIQGESISQGYPTVFVRFTGCNLRCSYCDTKYAYYDGTIYNKDDIIKEINKYSYKRVCITGGEPLLQHNIQDIIDMLKGYEMSIETNGSIDLSQFKLHKNHRFVMDMKVPSSNCSDKMYFKNFDYLKEEDEIKFVIGDRNDYNWSKEIIKKYYKKGLIIFTPIFDIINIKDIVKWVLDDRLDVRVQVQLQKFIWGKNERGV